MDDNDSKSWDFFELPRPQYPSTPEILLSSLMWGLHNRMTDQRPVQDGIVFKLSTSKKGNSGIKETVPKTDEDWAKMASVIEGIFHLSSVDVAEIAAKTIVGNLIGNSPAKANSMPAIPLSLTMSMMQNARGSQGAKNPPNFFQIIEVMYALGGGTKGAASQLLRAYQHLASQKRETWLEVLSDSLAPEVVLDAVQQLRAGWEPVEGQAISPLQPTWLANWKTPFHWFAASWDALMEGSWIDVMPRRRWIDWCSCVLRTSLGMGYVFEMNFYFHLVLALANDKPEKEVLDELRGDRDPFFEWDSFASVSSRDVSTKIKKLCERGIACRDFLHHVITSEEFDCPSPKKYRMHEDGLVEWIKEARVWFANTGPDQIDQLLRDAISGRANSSAKNVKETIVYSLLDRGTPGLGSDLYSLLKRRGSRYTIVEPGQDWFVVLSSLCAKEAGRTVRLADVIDSLHDLGVAAGHNTLIRQLERVGLARTSHDADDAIEVQAAF